MKKDLFFSPDFSMEFDWKGVHHLRVGSVLPQNKKQISDGLRYLSHESIHNRFLGSKRAFTDKELEYLTVLDGWNHYAMGIEEREKLKRGIGIIRMVRSSDIETEAEIAITIIDEYQNMGLGTFLMELMILAAKERKIETLSFTFLPQNDAIIKLIKKTGIPLPGSHNHDCIQLFLDLTKLDIKEIKNNLVKTLPEISHFKEK